MKVGFNALVGISIHTVIEAFAIGTITGKSEATFMFLVLSIAIHTFFEVPAMFSSFLAVLSKTTWWICVVIFSFVTPVGLLMGMVTASSVDPEVSAFLQCFAAGTLIAVGINHMLMPAIADGTQWRVGKVVAAFLTATVLAVLPLVLSVPTESWATSLGDAGSAAMIGFGAVAGIAALIGLCALGYWLLPRQNSSGGENTNKDTFSC